MSSWKMEAVPRSAFTPRRPPSAAAPQERAPLPPKGGEPGAPAGRRVGHPHHVDRLPAPAAALGPELGEAVRRRVVPRGAVRRDLPERRRRPPEEEQEQHRVEEQRRAPLGGALAERPGGGPRPQLRQGVPAVAVHGEPRPPRVPEQRPVDGGELGDVVRGVAHAEVARGVPGVARAVPHADPGRPGRRDRPVHVHGVPGGPRAEAARGRELHRHAVQRLAAAPDQPPRRRRRFQHLPQQLQHQGACGPRPGGRLGAGHAMAGARAVPSPAGAAAGRTKVCRAHGFGAVESWLRAARRSELSAAFTGSQGRRVRRARRGWPCGPALFLRPCPDSPAAGSAGGGTLCLLKVRAPTPSASRTRLTPQSCATRTTSARRSSTR